MYRSRGLRLVATVADGWIPSLGYVSLDELHRASETIDAEARAAGRNPDDITRILNVGGFIGDVERRSIIGGQIQRRPALLRLPLRSSTRGASAVVRARALRREIAEGVAIEPHRRGDAGDQEDEEGRVEDARLEREAIDRKRPRKLAQTTTPCSPPRRPLRARP